jgi:PHP family Zn ribbon phosphoesterase
MSATIEFVPPAEVLFQPADKKSQFTNRQLELFRPSSIYEPEQRLWKLASQALSSQFAMIEFLVLGLFLAAGLAEVISCFAELSHLFDSDAIGHVAMRAIGAAG